MNMLDLAVIHAAALGLSEAEGPNVLQLEAPTVSGEQHINRLREIIRESDARQKRIAAARRPLRVPRSPRERKAVKDPEIFLRLALVRRKERRLQIGYWDPARPDMQPILVGRKFAADENERIKQA